MCRHLSLSGQ